MKSLENEEYDEVSLKEIILKIKRLLIYVISKWYIILIMIVLGAIAGYIYSSRKHVLYTAVCSFIVEGGQPASQLTGIAALLSGSSGGGGEGLFQGSTLLSLYTTRLMLEKALFSSADVNGKRMLLIDWYLQINKEGKDWSSVPVEERSGMISNIVSKIRSEYVSVESSDFVIVKVKSPNEFFSKIFAEKLIETVNNFYIQTKTKKSLKNLSILQKQADSLRRIMTRSMVGAAAAADAYPNANPARKVLAVPAQRKAVDVQAATSLYSGVVASLETTKMELRRETPLIQIIDKPMLPLDKNVPDIKNGILMGGILSGLAAIVTILLHFFYKKLMSDESI